MQIYVNKIEDIITLKIKSRYFLGFSSPETEKMLGSTEKILKDTNSENVSRLEINEVVLVHCNLVNKTYQHDSRVLHTFILNKSIGKLLEISPTNFIFL